MKDLSNLEVFDYFKILWNRRWYSLIIFILVSVGASIYAWQVKDIYKSEARIVVDTILSSEDFMKTNVRSLTDDRYNAIREQLASRTFLEQMIEQFQMYGYGTRPDFVMEQAVKAAQRQIGIARTSDRTFTISYVATDPKFAQTVTKQLSQELIRSSSRSKEATIIGANRFFDELLKQAEDDVKLQEERIKQFKMAHLGELPGQEGANINALAGMHSQLTAVENAITQTQMRLETLEFSYQERKRLDAQTQNRAASDLSQPGADNEAALSALSPREIELAQKKELLAQYLTKYTKSHPDVKSLNADIQRLEQQAEDVVPSAESASIQTTEGETAEKVGEVAITEPANTIDNQYRFQVNRINAEIENREKERQNILQQIRIYRARLNLAPALEQELATLMREQENVMEKYDNLQRRKLAAQMGEEVEIGRRDETYRIVDAANLPFRAEYPDRTQIVLLGIGIGFLLGIGAAFAREFLDSTISTEDEAKKILNLPVLATIPIIYSKKGKEKTAA